MWVWMRSIVHKKTTNYTYMYNILVYRYETLLYAANEKMIKKR